MSADTPAGLVGRTRACLRTATREHVEGNEAVRPASPAATAASLGRRETGAGAARQHVPQQFGGDERRREQQARLR